MKTKRIWSKNLKYLNESLKRQEEHIDERLKDITQNENEQKGVYAIRLKKFQEEQIKQRKKYKKPPIKTLRKLDKVREQKLIKKSRN